MGESPTPEIYLARAFGDSERTGNPAGVVIGAHSLGREEKQDIAKRIGFSETAFVTDTPDADVQLEFFTPSLEIENCGHATVATLYVLKKLGRLKENCHTFRTKANPQIKSALFLDGKVFMEQFPESCKELTGELRAAALKTISVKGEAPAVVSEPALVSTGNRFLLLEVESPAYLARLSANLPQLEAFSREQRLIGSYVYARIDAKTAIATTRMFAPLYGIPEESATGMAAGTLAHLLHNRKQTPSLEIELEQGSYMSPPSPSRIFIKFERNTDQSLRSLFVGGAAFFAPK